MKKYISYLQSQCIKAHTKEWYNIRQNKISATNIGTIININNFKNKNDLLNDKIYGLDIIDNKYTRHGNKFEDIAISILEKKLNIDIHEIGFKLSDKYDFLGATPDGITIFNNNLYLVEIKCPLTRKISGLPSFNYYSQIQTQLEVFNIDKCLFFECNLQEITKDEYNKFKKDYHCGYNKIKNIYWKLNEASLNVVNRDNIFFNSYSNDIKTFYNHLINKNTKILEKSNFSESYYTKKYIKDYLLDNKCNTWLDIYGKKYYEEFYEDNQFSKEILTKSIEKKRNFYDIIKNICSENNLDFIVIPSYHEKNDYLINLTKTYMNKKYDVIINPYLYDNESNFYSNPTLIINNNSLNYFNIPDNKNSGYTIINKVIKNIKFINNGNNLSNDIKHSYFKICNELDSYVLNKNQNYQNYNSYIIGEKWNYIFSGEKIISVENNDFNKLVQIKINSFRNIKKNIYNYKKWIDYIKNKDDKFILFNDNEFIPLISSNEQSNWSKLKKYILKTKNDVQLVYGIGNITKKKLSDMNINSWKDKNFQNIINDENNILNLSLINKKIINNIINLNLYSNNLIYPPNKNNQIINDLKKNKLEIFCDFETINNFLGNDNIIYLIGMTIKNPNDNIKYEYFFAETSSNEDEKKILDNFIDRINELQNIYNTNAVIYCWSKAENNFINNFNKKNNLNYFIDFTDLLEIFKNNSILVKDNIYGFGLKNYVEVMYDYNMINKNYKDGSCDSGDKSIISAIKYYNNNDLKSYNDLIKYNEIDCTVMYEILTFFRKYYNIK